MIRLRPPGILPLELWDLLTPDGSILWDHMQSPHFGAVLCAVMEQAWRGTAVTRSEGRVSMEARAFHTLHLTGGGAPAVLDAMRHGPWSRATLSREPAFGAALGGQALLSAQKLDGWVLDVGQSGIKLSHESKRLQHPRDWIRLPLRDDDQMADIEDQRAGLRSCIASLLTEMHHACSRWPAGLVAALPSRLDDQGVPEGSSYIGMNGDRSLLADAMLQAGMPAIPLFVLNDAELAAVSARHEFEIVPPALVLTIGFGVGGALILGA